jgi:hypothetical protein
VERVACVCVTGRLAWDFLAALFRRRRGHHLRPPAGPAVQGGAQEELLRRGERLQQLPQPPPRDSVPKGRPSKHEHREFSLYIYIVKTLKNERNEPIAWNPSLAITSVGIRQN